MIYLFVHPEFKSVMKNDIAILYIEPFDDPKVGDILTSVNQPKIQDSSCKIVGWLNQVCIFFFRQNR